MGLKEKMQAIAVARRELDFQRKQKAQVEESFKLEYQRLFDNVATLKTDLSILESQAKEDALREFKDTGSKQVIDGITIKEQTVVVYNLAKALEWARQHDIALQLDKVAFDKVMKAMPAGGVPDFVEITKEPQAQISSDLNKYLEVMESAN